MTTNKQIGSLLKKPMKLIELKTQEKKTDIILTDKYSLLLFCKFPIV